MYDLIGAHARLSEIYRLYVESAFPFRYPALDVERRHVLGASGVLAQEPLVEPVPIYPSSSCTLRDAAERLGSEYVGLGELGAGLVAPTTRLYEHQLGALDAVVGRGRDRIVTTGTGSGKTECFLLPVLAELVRESVSWPACTDNPDRFWWRTDGKRVGQWAHSSRAHGVRALILYPLNALVEDQLRRLRMTLDSDAVHTWLDHQRKGNRILFGRYTGSTPVPGRSSASATVRRLKRSLQQLDSAWRRVSAALRNAACDGEIRYHFPRVDGGEMWSRWDMQETPPDVLITNYSMLNIMLMRDIEERIFASTRDWLSASRNNVFFLVVDELHSYRGTPGTEVAYILRLFLERIGLSPASDQLRILATSASVDQGDKSRQFLREFFGRNDRFELISGRQIPPRERAHTVLKQHAGRFAAFAAAVQPDPLATMAAPSIDSPASIGAIETLATALGVHRRPNEPPEQALERALDGASVTDAVRDACQIVNRTVRATRVTDLDRVLFDSPAAPGVLASDALRGLLLAMGIARRPSGVAPQPMRGHLFFHNLENLWVCTNPSCDDPLCDGNARAAQNPAPPCGTLHPHHRLTCSCGARVLDLVICSGCGEVFFGGFTKPVTLGQQALQLLTPDQPHLEHLPDQSGWTKRHSHYGVFWPSEDDAVRPSYQHNGERHSWDLAAFDPFTGLVQFTASP